MRVINNDKKVICELAKKWMEIANEPIMQKRKKLWSDLHSLKPTQPMILFETGTVIDYIKEDELLCENHLLRGIEKHMREEIRHATEVGDDIVLEPYYRIGWEIIQPSFGVDISQKDSSDNTSIGYDFNHPIKTPDDIKKLVKREFILDKNKTLKHKNVLDDMFGDILPVKLGNHSFMTEGIGDYSWAGNFFFGLTWQLHRFIGQGEMLYWYYDYPDAMHELMEYMLQDRMRMFKLLEDENCLVSNTDSHMAGPRCYGYTEDLPKDTGKPARLNQLWAWAESQETTGISLSMYKEFVLPYLSRMAKDFGLIYYGCCEQVHDRLEAIEKEIPNVRCVSVSPWSNLDIVGEMIGDKYVYSRKPTAQYISGSNPDWDAIKNDLERTKQSAKGNLEVLFRDVYDINHDRKRLSEWVQLAKYTFGR